MFVNEVASLSQLYPVQFTSECEVHSGFSEDIPDSFWVHPPEIDVLEVAERSAHRRTDEDGGLLFNDYFLRFRPLFGPVEVPRTSLFVTCSDVHSKARQQIATGQKCRHPSG